jgi:hypothetical protein
MRIAFIITSIIMLVGCKTLAERQGAFTQEMDAFVGSNADELVVKRGPPSNVATLSTGGKVLEYSKSRTVTSGGGSFTTYASTYDPGTKKWVNVPQQQAIPVSSKESHCKILFKVSPSNIVESWTSEGNGCY